MTRITLTVATILLFACGSSHAAGDRDTKVRNDRKTVQAAGGWIYNDLRQGMAAAKKEGKPLLVVIRCIP